MTVERVIVASSSAAVKPIGEFYFVLLSLLLLSVFHCSILFCSALFCSILLSYLVFYSIQLYAHHTQYTNALYVPEYRIGIKHSDSIAPSAAELQRVNT